MLLKQFKQICTFRHPNPINTKFFNVAHNALSEVLLLNYEFIDRKVVRIAIY